MLEYLHSLSSEEDAIFQADKTVTAAEKQVEGLGNKQTIQ